MADIIVQSFNAGELSPLLDGRSDMEKYYSGCRIHKNMIPLPYGPSERRPGTYYVAELKDSDKKARLQSFQYSSEQAYILEFGDQYCRFYRNRGQILSGEGTENIDHLDNRISHWKMNESNGVTLTDDEGNHDGTVSTDCSNISTTGKVGEGCLDLDGQYDIDCGDHNDFSFTNNSDDSAFSINCWGYVTEKDNIQVLMSKWRDQSTTQEWRFSLTADRKLQLHLADSSDDLTSLRIAHWKLNENAPNQTVLDDDPTSHDGLTETANTTDLSTTGKNGTCFDFGGTDCVIITNDHDELSFGDGSSDNAFSISVWIYWGGGSYQIIVSKADYTTGSELREWTLYLDSLGKLVFRIWDNSEGKSSYVFIGEPLSSGWHHIVATYDGTGGSSAHTGMKLYLDNVNTSTYGNTQSGYVAMENTAAKVHIGAHVGSGGSPTQYYNSLIDNVILFNDELSVSQVNKLYNDGNGTESLAGSVTTVYAITEESVNLGWHMLSCTCSAHSDRTAAADDIILYVDGAAVASTATNDANYTAMQNGAEEVRIGSQRNSGDTANENFWNDKIDEVSIFSDVLTPTEIAGLYTSVAYEIETDYLEPDLFSLQHAQSADVLFTVHGSYAPSKIIRHEHALWEIEDTVFDWPPFMSENSGDTTITPSAKIGTITLTASSSIFTSGMVGGYFLIKHPRTDNYVEKQLTTDYSAYASTGITDILVDVDGGYRIKTAGTWGGTVVLQRSYDGELILVLDSAPASGAWEAGDIITGGTSGECCIIVSVKDSTHYYIKQLTGSFDDNETLSNQTGNSRACAATYPRYEGWSVLESLQSESDQNFNSTGTEILGNAYLRAERTVDSAGNDPTVTISVERFYNYGIVKITGYTSGTVVTAEVIRVIGSTEATKLWSEGLWSDERGWPVTTCFYESRQWYAGSYYNPLDIVGSVTNQYNNMQTGDLADDAVKYTIDSSEQNLIRWMVGEEVLLIGTSGGEWKLGSYDPSDGVSPTNPIKPRKQTTYGSKALQAIHVASAVLFVDSQGRKVRGAQYIFEQGQQGAYDAPDYTMLAEHITESGIVDMAFQQNPYPILWCVRDDGVLIGMVFEPGHKIWGWFECEIDGDVESVAVIRGTTEDEVWIIVNRTINGSTKRYVEYFKPRNWGSDQADCFFVDCGLTFDGGSAVTITGVSLANPCVVTAANSFSNGDQVKIISVGGTTELNNKIFTVANATTTNFELKDKLNSVNIDSTGFTTYTSGGSAQKVENSFSGLDHLEGKEVSVLGDGSAHPNVTVSSGAITLTDYYNKVHVGLPFTSSLQPMKLNVPGSDIRGKQKRISQIIFSFYKTLGAKFGPTSGDETIPFRKVTDPLGSAPPLFTGEKVQTFNGGYELEGDIYVEQTQPLPMTVRSITVKTGIYD